MPIPVILAQLPKTQITPVLAVTSMTTPGEGEVEATSALTVGMIQVVVADGLAVEEMTLVADGLAVATPAVISVAEVTSAAVAISVVEVTSAAAVINPDNYTLGLSFVD